METVTSPGQGCASSDIRELPLSCAPANWARWHPKSPAPDLAPDVARLLAYSKVVEWYHRERTVIPLRYGCILNTLSDLRRLLKDHQREYLQVLGELDGHAEMSARVALDEPRSFTSLRTNLARALARFAGRHRNRPGIAYLAGRSNYYACREDLDRRCEEIRRSICEIAEGTFVRCAAECSERGGKGVLTLHFLVSRLGGDRLKQALRSDARAVRQCGGRDWAVASLQFRAVAHCSNAGLAAKCTLVV